MKKILKAVVLFSVLMLALGFVGCSTSSNSDRIDDSSQSDNDYFTGEGDYNGIAEDDFKKGKVSLKLSKKYYREDYPEEGINYYECTWDFIFDNESEDIYSSIYISDTKMVDTFYFNPEFNLISNDGGKTFKGTYEHEGETNEKYKLTLKKKE